MRLLVLVLNIPPIVVSLQSYNIIQLFLLANLLTSTSTIPVCMGLWRHRLSYKYVTSTTCLAGCLTGFVSLLVWAKIKISIGNYSDPNTGAVIYPSYSYALHDMFFVTCKAPKPLFCLLNCHIVVTVRCQPQNLAFCRLKV